MVDVGVSTLICPSAKCVNSWSGTVVDNVWAHSSRFRGE